MWMLSTALMHFNPLPRKEGDTPDGEPPAEETISIHSLVKRETPSSTMAAKTS